MKNLFGGSKDPNLRPPKVSISGQYINHKKAKIGLKGASTEVIMLTKGIEVSPVPL
jgi:hypothetical protein